jgi:hypothetical protein
MMSYVDLNWDFSQFDRDNFNRFEAAAYVTNTNAIAERVLASPNAAAGLGDLATADSEIGLSAAAFAAHDYRGAFEHARLAYAAARRAATAAGVSIVVSDNGWTVLSPLKGKPAQKREYSHVDRYGPGTKRSTE